MKKVFKTAGIFLILLVVWLTFHKVASKFIPSEKTFIVFVLGAITIEQIFRFYFTDKNKQK